MIGRRARRRDLLADEPRPTPDPAPRPRTWPDDEPQLRAAEWPTRPGAMPRSVSHDTRCGWLQSCHPDCTAPDRRRAHAYDLPGDPIPTPPAAPTAHTHYAVLTIPPDPYSVRLRPPALIALAAGDEEECRAAVCAHVAASAPLAYGSPAPPERPEILLREAAVAQLVNDALAETPTTSRTSPVAYLLRRLIARRLADAVAEERAQGDALASALRRFLTDPDEYTDLANGRLTIDGTVPLNEAETAAVAAILADR